MPADWAMPSIIRTPGITGSAGKWPWKKGSLMVTFLMPTIRFPSWKSTMRSTRSMG